MKCVLSVLLLAVCASKLISAIPLRNGMVFYQSQPDYYNSHRAFVMQYASQPARTYRRRNGEPANLNGVSAFVAGKKISTGTFVKRKWIFLIKFELKIERVFFINSTNRKL